MNSELVEMLSNGCQLAWIIFIIYAYKIEYFYLSDRIFRFEVARWKQSNKCIEDYRCMLSQII